MTNGFPLKVGPCHNTNLKHSNVISTIELHFKNVDGLFNLT